MNTKRRATLLFFALVLLVLTTMLAAGQVPETAAAPNRVIKILSIGDSNTVGYANESQSGCRSYEKNYDQYASYRYWLYGLLKQDGYDAAFLGSNDTAYCPRIYADPPLWGNAPRSNFKLIGWNSQTTTSINAETCDSIGPASNWCLRPGLAAAEADLIQGDRLYVLIHLGTNDVADAISGTGPAQGWGTASKTALIGILDKLKQAKVANELGEMNVLLAKILPGRDSRDDKYLDTTRVDHFNLKLEHFCEGNEDPQNTDPDHLIACSGSDIPKGSGFNVFLVNMNNGFTISDHLQSDGIHTIPLGEEKMAERWKQHILYLERGTPVLEGVEIVKEVVGPPATEDWEFTLTTPSGEEVVFGLPPDGGSRIFKGLEEGYYLLSETAKPGWQRAVTCSPVTNPVTGPNGEWISFRWEQEMQYVSCTYTNTTRPGTITVVKEVDGPAPDHEWPFTIDDEDFGLSPTGGQRDFMLAPGQHTIEEAPVYGYSQSVTCNSGETGTGSVMVDLQPEEKVTCTFTNTSKGVPIGINEVAEGTISANGEVDYFRFTLGGPVLNYALMDIDAQINGSSLNSVVCLHDSAGSDIACNDDTDTPDSLLYHGMYPGDYYISVRDAQGLGSNNHTYKLIFSSPLLVSAAAAGFKEGGTVDGIQFYSEDILGWSKLNNGQERWVMFFDGSDVGIKGNVWNIAGPNGPTDQIFIGLRSTQTLPGGVLSTPWDILIFDPDKYGPETAGNFILSFKGAKEHELSNRGERIDAFDNWVFGFNVNGGSLDYDSPCYGFPVSTVGRVKVTSGDGTVLRGRDGDVFCRVYDDQAGGWRWWEHFGSPGGNVVALAYADERYFSWSDGPDISLEYRVVAKPDTCTQWSYYAAYEEYSEEKVPVTPMDIWTKQYYTCGGGCNPDIFYEGEFCVIRWHGPDHGWNYPIDAIEWQPWPGP